VKPLGKILLILIFAFLVIWIIVGLLQIRLIKSIEEEIKRGDKAENRDKEAKILFKKGEKFYSSGDYDKAIEYFTRAIEIEPNNSEFYYWRAKAYYEKGKQFDLKYDGGNIIVMAFVRFIRWLYKNRNFNKAIEDLTKAISYKFYDAVEDFTKAITYGGWNFIYYQNRGEAYERMGLKNKARIDFIKAKILKFLKFFDIWEKLERDEIKQREAEIRDLYLYVKYRISDIERKLAKKEFERKIKKIQKQLYSWGNKDLEEWMKIEKEREIMIKKKLEQGDWVWKQMMKELPLIIKQLNER
jgi:tetratricopeptide (TPR) repeat protein